MSFVITNIYNKKTKGPTLTELFMATGKLKKFFWQLEMFDMCTMGDTAHIATIFKFLPYTRQHGCIDISPYSDIAMIYLTADVECCFFTELHPFQEMIIGTH